MPCRLRAELAEVFELADVHSRIASEVEQRVKQHRAVTGREHEPVAVRPRRIGRVEAERFGKEHGGHVRHAHRHAGVARIGLLHRIHGERANRIRHIAGAGRRPLLRVSRLAHPARSFGFSRLPAGVLRHI